jgi:putative tryptophan/tyrosine transport system substrate-binding protein
MKRRAFMAGLGSTLSLPFVARAQDKKQIVGFLRTTPAAPFAHIVAAFRDSLAKAGFKEGQNVVIEQRWADNKLNRLPEFARDLVQRGSHVIVGNGPAIQAAKTVTTTVPLVFVAGDDPVNSGLVASMSRPGGNVTGITFFGGSHLNAKRMDLLRDVVPRATTIAVLVDSNYAEAMHQLPNVEAAARTLGQRLVTIPVGKESELEAAFEKAMQAGAAAMLVSGGPLITSQRQRVVALAAKHHLPAIYDLREFVQAGGLMSYSANLAGAYQHAGAYAARILNGAQPADLPVLQATQIELAINLKTAKSLGVTIPLPLQAAADEVIE